jgi:ankyrin repeat protein
MDLISACEQENVVAVKNLLDSGIDPNYRCFIHVRYYNGTTALHLAVSDQNFEIVKILLNAGAHLDITNCRGSTPLMNAVRGGNIDILDYLLKRNPDLNISDIYGNSVLHIAIMEYDIKCINILLSYGPDTSLKNNEGYTPLDLAKNKNYKAGIAVLEEYEEFPIKGAID